MFSTSPLFAKPSQLCSNHLAGASQTVIRETDFQTKYVENFGEIPTFLRFFWLKGICNASLKALFRFGLGISTHSCTVSKFDLSPKKDPASTKLEQGWVLRRGNFLCAFRKGKSGLTKLVRKSIWPRELWIGRRLYVLQSESGADHQCMHRSKFTRTNTLKSLSLLWSCSVHMLASINWMQGTCDLYQGAHSKPKKNNKRGGNYVAYGFHVCPPMHNKE